MSINIKVYSYNFSLKIVFKKSLLHLIHKYAVFTDIVIIQFKFIILCYYIFNLKLNSPRLISFKTSSHQNPSEYFFCCMNSKQYKIILIRKNTSFKYIQIIRINELIHKKHCILANHPVKTFIAAYNLIIFCNCTICFQNLTVFMS